MCLVSWYWILLVVAASFPEFFVDAFSPLTFFFFSIYLGCWWDTDPEVMIFHSRINVCYTLGFPAAALSCGPCWGSQGRRWYLVEYF